MNKDFVIAYLKEFGAGIYKKKYFKEEILPYIILNVSDKIIKNKPKEILYWFINELDDYPKCKAPNCTNKVTRLPNGLNTKYGKCCSSECSGKYTSSKATQESRKEAAKKGALTNKSKTTKEKKLIQNKKENTKFNNFGDKNYNNRGKAKESCLEKYGVENPQQAAEVKEKTKETKFLKYGDRNFVNIEKMKDTKLEKYGDANYNNPKKISETNKMVWASGTDLRMAQSKSYNMQDARDKADRTIKEKYGVDNVSQLDWVQDKKLLSGYKTKTYFLPSGKKIKLQGYEPKLLDELLLKYNEELILTDSIDMPEFWYIGEDGKNHRYFPDAYIPSTNTIYEVKSEYTIKCEVDKNKRKFNSVKEAGYNFELKIY